MTSVLDLNTGTFTDYTLPPVEAVTAAYAQREKHNFNTWEYDKYQKLVTISDSIKPGVTVVSLGNQSTLSQAGKEHSYPLNDYEVGA